MRQGNQVFRLDLKAGRFVHVAGTCRSGFAPNGGPAKLAELKGPKGIAVHRAGPVWLADTESHTDRRIEARKGGEGVAGTGEKGGGPEGASLACRMAR